MGWKCIRNTIVFALKIRHRLCTKEIRHLRPLELEWRKPSEVTNISISWTKHWSERGIIGIHSYVKPHAVLAALERDRANSDTIWTWFKCTENHCWAAEKERRPPFRLTTTTCVWKKELSQGKNVVHCAYVVLSPRSHSVANCILYCFLSDVMNIWVKWRKLETQESRQD